MASQSGLVIKAAGMDGRRHRAALTRQRIVDAAIALPREGNFRASLQEISDRAGVSLRTVFEHFPERDLLTRAVLNQLTHFDRADPPPPDLLKPEKLNERIALFLDSRVARLEKITPHRQVSNGWIASWPLLQRHRVKVRALYRRIVEAWFVPELARLQGEHRERMTVGVASLVDWEMWWSLRAYPERTVAEAKAILHLMLKQILLPANEDQSRSRLKVKKT
jgi:TetR/AcrR family transcriptional regulator of autoinduction and epiphytic fitness